MAPKYHPVPQRDEIIILDHVSGPYSYNPSSAAAAAADTESLHSIPNSPPPSFHSHSTPSTPRPTPSSTAASLWGVAESTVALTDAGADHDMDETHTEICAASDALGTIRVLQTRVARLEESLGKLLLEREEWKMSALEHEHGSGSGRGKRDNRSHCCVYYSELSPDLERVMLKSSSNCCMYLSGRKDSRNKSLFAGTIFCVMIVAGMILAIVAIKNGKHGCSGPSCNPEWDGADAKWDS